MLRAGHVILAAVLALLMLGIVMVNSAGMTINAKNPVTLTSILTSRPAIFAGLAILAMGLAAYLPIFRLMPGVGRGQTLDELPDQRSSLPLLRAFGGWSLWPMWAGVALLIVLMGLVYVPGLQREVNGSHRWLSLPFPGARELSVQPSEIAKWTIIAILAWYAWKVGSGVRSFFFGLAPAIVATGAVAGFVVIEDLGTGTLIGVTAAVMLLVAGARWWHFGMFVPLAAAAFVAAVYASPYRMKRLTSFLDPYVDSQGAGYHQIQSMVAVSDGNVWGRGLGFSVSKFGYLPEDTTDFIYAIICNELGIPGAAIVVALYLALIWAGYAIIIKQREMVLRLIGTGIVTMVGVQAIVNLAVVTGAAPTKGIALPLVSSGGTGWILTAASLGLLVNMDRISVRRAQKNAASNLAIVTRPQASQASQVAQVSTETRSPSDQRHGAVATSA